MANVRVVLVRAETPQNVGAAARVVRNAGLVGLDLVAPAGDWRTIECWRSAWGAHQVLEQARVFDDLASALSGSSLSAAFSGRFDSGAPAQDVRDVAYEVASLGPEAAAALVFGPESAGLSGEEIALCGRRARIPAHPDQPSLNLSHAVMVAAYEVFRSGRFAGPVARRATHDEKERMLGLLRDGLLAIGALPEANTYGFFSEWRALFQRADLTPRELRLLEHMARRMLKTVPSPPDSGHKTRRQFAGDSGSLPLPGEGQGGGSMKDDQQPFADVRFEKGGFSIPELKWRELLFVGALRPEGDLFLRDPQVPLPPFRQPGLFPEGVRLRASQVGGRVLMLRASGPPRAHAPERE